MPAMNLAAILDRISARLRVVGLSERALSERAGSADLIRNWRRKVKAGDTGGANHESLRRVADELGVTLNWLLHGGAATPDSQGMAEDAAEFTTPPAAQAQVAGLFAAKARHPAPTHRAITAMPDFAIAAGDLLICDLSRGPEPGELAIVSMIDEQAGTARTLVRRYLPPWLLSGSGDITGLPDRDDADGCMIRHPIIGSIRGGG